MSIYLSCQMAFRADLELSKYKIDLAEMHFQECLHVAQGIDASLESFCLERLAEIKLWCHESDQHVLFHEQPVHVLLRVTRLTWIMGFTNQSHG